MRNESNSLNRLIQTASDLVCKAEQAKAQILQTSQKLAELSVKVDVLNRQTDTDCKEPTPSPSPTLIFPPMPQPTNIRERGDDNHRRTLRENLSENGEECVSANDNPNSLNPESAHHIVPLNHVSKGIGDIHEVLAGCGIDIDDAKNGVCLDHDTHIQTYTSSPRNLDSYVQQIMQILNFEDNINQSTSGLDCGEIENKLRQIKLHLKNQNQISQSGGTPQVDLSGLNL